VSALCGTKNENMKLNNIIYDPCPYCPSDSCPMSECTR
jgi:hypothetical protein